MEQTRLEQLGYNKNFIKKVKEKRPEFTGIDIQSLFASRSITPDFIKHLSVGQLLAGELSVGQYIQSTNFGTTTGFKLDANGTITAQKFNQGTTSITVATTDNIQTAIDTVNAESGGTVILKPGVHVRTSDITLYSNISLIGDNTGNTTIYFAGTASSIKAQGTNVYTTGTISATPGSATVTGVGTSWSSNLTTSYSLFCGYAWFDIASVDSNTQVTLTRPFTGLSQSGITYRAAIIKKHIAIENLTVTASSTHGIAISDTYFPVINHVISAANGGDGIRSSYCSPGGVSLLICLYNGGNGISLIGSAYHSLRDFLTSANVGNGLDISSNSYGNVISAFYADNNNIGVRLDGLDNSPILMGNCKANINEGILVNNCSFCSFDFWAIGNGGDGAKISGTSSYNAINGRILKNNIGYGINVADKTCIENNILGIVCYGNIQGNINNNGTRTKIAMDSIVGYYPTDKYELISLADTQVFHNDSAVHL